MTYLTAIIGLLVLFICSLLWMFLVQGEQNGIDRKLLRLCLVLFLVGTLFGMIGLLYREPIDYLNTVGLALVMMVLMSLYTWWYWYKRQLFQLEGKTLMERELPQAVAIVCLATAAILHGLWATEVPKYKTSTGNMLWVAPVTIVILAPLLIALAHRYWNRIPVVRQYFEPWVLPIDRQVPVIEPTADAKRIYFKIPVEENSVETVDVDINAPNEAQLKSIFHHMLYRNKLERRNRSIMVAYNNRKEFRYGWLLYRLQHRWWWFDKKIYLELDAKVRFVDIVDGEIVFAERVRPWEN